MREAARSAAGHRDLTDPDHTRGIAEQVGQLGHMDAVIHNAGVHTGPHILPVDIIEQQRRRG